jgi:hypothetical protein
MKPVVVARLLSRIREQLDLVWIADGEKPAATSVATDRGVELPSELAQPLRELGELGHVRGILDKLDEIDSLDTRYRAHTAQLRGAVKAFRLGDFMRALDGIAP